MTLEEVTNRLVKLETEMALINASKTIWPDSLFGSMAAFPEFSEVVRLGKEWRESQQLDSPSKPDVGAA